MSQTATILNMRTALYRHYDVEGNLLYVWVSLSPMARTSQHSSCANWFDDVARIEIEWHESRSDALDAECIAIHCEKPFYNSRGGSERFYKLMCHFPRYRHFNLRTASEILDAAGRENLANRVGVKVRVIQHHASKGVLPASWFAALEEMTGKPLPRHLFSFKGIDAAGGAAPARAWVDQ